MNYSNYKKRTLSKYRTKAKNKITPLKIKLNKKNIEIQDLEVLLLKLRGESKNIETEYERNVNLTNNITKSINN